MYASPRAGSERPSSIRTRPIPTIVDVNTNIMARPEPSPRTYITEVEEDATEYVDEQGIAPGTYFDATAVVPAAPAAPAAPTAPTPPSSGFLKLHMPLHVFNAIADLYHSENTRPNDHSSFRFIVKSATPGAEFLLPVHYYNTRGSSLGFWMVKSNDVGPKEWARVRETIAGSRVVKCQLFKDNSTISGYLSFETRIEIEGAEAMKVANIGYTEKKSISEILGLWKAREEFND